MHVRPARRRGLGHAAWVLIAFAATLLTAAPPPGGLLLTRGAADLRLDSDSHGWVCSIEVVQTGFDDGRRSGNVEIRLQEVDLTNQTLGPPLVVENGDWETLVTQSCSVQPLPELGKVVVAYDWMVLEGGFLPRKMLRTAVYDVETESFVITGHDFGLPLNWPNSDDPPGVQIRRLGDSLIVTHFTIDAGPLSIYLVRRFADLEALLANDHSVLDLGPEPLSRPAHNSAELWVDEAAGLATLRYSRQVCPAEDSLGQPPHYRLARWDAEGNLVHSSDEGEQNLIATNGACMGNRAFGPTHFNTATGAETFISIIPPVPGLVGYPLMRAEDGVTDQALHDLTPTAYYGIRSEPAEDPAMWGFPFTLDVVLSSDDQWVLASRDHETSRLALHRFPAAFAMGESAPHLEPGTQRPGPRFCGTARSLAADLLFDYNNLAQNMLVAMEEVPSGGELAVVYFECPSGDEADAGLVLDVVPLDFPTLVDDGGYATPRGQALTVAAPGVLDNDSGLDSPTLEVFKVPTHGAVAIEDDGSFVYTPVINHCGGDQFTYGVLQDGETYLARASIDVDCTASAWWTFDELKQSTFLADDDRVLDVGGTSRDAYTVESTGSSGPGVVAGSPATGGSPALELSSSDTDQLIFGAGYASFNDGGPAAGPALNFAAGDSFTLEALIRLPENSADDSDVIVGKVSGEGESISWFMQVSSAGFLQGKIHDGTTFTTVNGTLLIDDDTWRHVAFVRDTGADELRLYVDGVLDGTEEDTTTGTLTNGIALAIGAFASGSRQFGGLIDEVRITPDALAPEDFLYSGAYYPAAEPDDAESPTGAPVVVDVTANDDFGLDGPQPGAIQIVSIERASAMVDDGTTPLDPTDDQIEVAPYDGFAGTAEVVYRITDFNGDVSEATVSVQVGIFGDGFESGDTTSWSATTP